MTAKPTHSNSQNDWNIESKSEFLAIIQVLDRLYEEQESVLASEEDERENTSINLPEPDSENITVLTRKLPNKPILPWNRFDSPWEDSKDDVEEEDSNNSAYFQMLELETE
jgi:hypothetical protein